MYLDLAAGRVVPIKGTTKDDVLTGTDDADVIQGLGGEDMLSGLGGNDRLNGGAGTDRVDGGDGDDSIVEADPDGDTLSGGGGNDTITVAQGARDTADTVLTLLVGDGDDHVTLTTDRETLVIDLGAGDDRLDLRDYTYTNQGTRTITLGSGRDTIVLNPSSFVSSSELAFHITDFQAGRAGDVFDLGKFALSSVGLPQGAGDDPFALGFAELVARGGDTLVVVQGRTVAVLDGVRVKSLVDENFGFDLDAPPVPGQTLVGTDRSESLFGIDLGDTITLLGGNDYALGRYGNDLIDGGAGIDSLAGDQGNDTLLGGDGNDMLEGGAGLDHISGGAGDDTILFYDADVIDGGDGVDTLVVSELDTGTPIDLDARLLPRDGPILLDGQEGTGLEAIRVGLGYLSWGDDRFLLGALWTMGLDLYGGDGDDQIMAGNGDSQLFGERGDDVLTSCDGDDTLDGGSGIDRVSAGGGDDTVSNDALVAGERFDGGGGNDTLTLRAGEAAVSFEVTSAGAVTLADGGKATIRRFEAVQVALSKSDDTVVLGANSKMRLVADGLAGNDRLVGGAGDDALTGGAGNDVLDGGTGRNVLSGGGDDDTYYLRSATDTVVEAERGGGTDAVFATVSVTLATGVENGTLLGSAALSLTGNRADNLLLLGNAGTNVLEGGFGSDRIDGAAGDDIASYASAVTGVTIDLNVRGGTVTASDGAGGTDTLVSVEGLIGSKFADVLTGGDGASSLSGGSGDDVLDGGGAGDDLVRGRLGNDLLIGGEGTDTVSFDRATAGVTVGLAGGRGGANGGAGTDSLAGFEFIVGSQFDDTISATDGGNRVDGSGGNDVIRASHDGAVLIGGDGIDTLDFSNVLGAVRIDLSQTGVQGTGYTGALTVVGFEAVAGTNAADTLIGSAGDDTLGGGLGNDLLTGGGGADKFVFASIGDVDTITDFQHGLDKIVFPGSLAGLTPGTLAEGMFRNGTVAQDSDDRILYDQNSGALSFDVDGVGGYDAFQVAVIGNHPTLSASDFVVI